MQDELKIYTPAEIAKITPLSLSRIYEEIKLGNLPAMISGRKYFVHHDNLKNYLKRIDNRDNNPKEIIPVVKHRKTLTPSEVLKLYS